MSSLTASTTTTTTTSAPTISNNHYTDPTSPTMINNTSQQESEQQRVPYKPPANNRSILILREIEPTSSESSVRDLFNSENCPSKPIHCEYALQNSWYVTFNNDEDARLALAFIRKHIVNWKGKPIMARYKPKPAVPSAANQPPPHHHIMPPMVMQQQQQRIHPEDNEVVTDSSILGGQVTSASSVIPSNVSSGHQSPIVSSPHALINNTGPTGGLTNSVLTPNDGQSVPLSNCSDLMTPYGPNDLYQASSLSSHHHHHHPDGSLVHNPHNHHHMNGPHNLMSPQSNQTIQHPHHQQLAAGYNLYYGQQGQIIQAPWDLSTVFVYNGLCPYNRNPSVNVSSVSLVGGAYHRGSNQQHVETRAHHVGDLEQNERKHRRRRRLD